MVVDPARRERAALLRSYEGSTLSRANFCVLKGLPEVQLEAQLTLARQEAAEFAAQHRVERAAAPQSPAPSVAPQQRSDERRPRDAHALRPARRTNEPQAR